MESSRYLTRQWQVLFVLWHQYRLLVFCLVASIALTVLVYQRFRRPREKLSNSPVHRAPKLAARVDDALAFPGRTERYDGKSSQDKAESHQITTASATLREDTLSQKAPLRRVTGSKIAKQRKAPPSVTPNIQPLIFFTSLSGTTEKHASDLAWNLHSASRDQNHILSPRIHDLSYIDYDDFFIAAPQSAPTIEPVDYFYVLLVPTYNIDTVLTTFLAHLQETHHDFRIDTAPLSGLAGYSVFGLGDRQGWPTEQDGFCFQAQEVDKWMARLTSGKRAFPLGMGDVKSDINERLAEWTDGVSKVLVDIAEHGGLGEGVLGSGDVLESDAEEGAGDVSVTADLPGQRRRQRRKTRVDDLEDIKGLIQPPKNPPQPIDFTTSKPAGPESREPKEMVPESSPTYAALTKQGYTIIGSHSGVKICRWTKSALRGRGSCYKYSFYGIKSHLCMETTPSLSCSNKCVFCWRHGTNPVGTSWRWKVDPPAMIFQGAKEGHLKKIKMMRGVPGVRAERFQEAMRIRHCALSLVGEPIFYPHINEFLRLLHGERISSFLVCNAQHPEQLQALDKVTQLYVSIDASNKESLRKVDRPLHRDFWERFLKCLDILREKRFQMRTVFRLTLVKGFNVEDEAEGYAALVARGLPCFVEVKGVTYCGTSSSAGAGLTMANVPFYEEVVAFVEALNAALRRRGLEYGIAAEHAHSCCILIASDRFFIRGKWHTLIDYDKFFACLEGGEEFAPEDYVGAPTPEWATFGNGGFDPADERVHKKGKLKRTDS
ncbi:MAG: hypothetical protein L6R39_000320 [Caloplaca ligustica]|nr:MAG: hypothetical protein L6R39_000320 [Caloplaca ligustica]